MTLGLRKLDRGRRIVVTVFYGLYLLLSLEATSRALFSVGPIFQRVKGLDDSSQRIAWVKRHSDQQQFVYKFDIYHPLRGWALQPNVKDSDWRHSHVHLPACPG